MLFYFYFNYNKLKTVESNIFATYTKAYNYYLAIYINSYNNNYYNRVPDLIFKKSLRLLIPN